MISRRALLGTAAMLPALIAIPSLKSRTRTFTIPRSPHAFPIGTTIHLEFGTDEIWVTIPGGKRRELGEAYGIRYTD